MKAARKNPKGEFTKDALYNAIGAFERVREKEEVRCGDKANTPCSETDNDKKFSEAIELYASYYPNDPELPELLFRQGKLYYERRIYDPAVRMFGQLLEKFPNSPFAADAGELVLDSFNRAADYQNIELWARKPKTAPAFKSPQAQARLNGLILGAVFQIGEQLAGKGEHEKAADAYVRAAKEFPNDPRAPKALYNAGLELSRAGQLARADEAYTSCVAKYPGSEEGALSAWNGAQMYESIASSATPRASTKRMRSAFPKAPRRPTRATTPCCCGFPRANTKRPSRTDAASPSASPRTASVDDVYFLIGRAHEAQRSHGERSHLSRVSTAHAERRIGASRPYTRLGQVFLEAGDRKSADGAFSDAVQEARRNKAKLAQGRYYAAEARYLQGDEALRDFEAVRDQGRPQGPERAPEDEGQAARQGGRHLRRSGRVRGGRVGHRRALQDWSELRAVRQGAVRGAAARGTQRARAAGVPRRARHVRGSHRRARARGVRGRLRQGARARHLQPVDGADARRAHAHERRRVPADPRALAATSCRSGPWPRAA